MGKKTQDVDDEDDQITQRMANNRCPRYCNHFECMLLGNCNDECQKLDLAQAMICELCDNKCESEKQKKVLLDTKYYQDKKKEFTRSIKDGMGKVQRRHDYLENRLTELRLDLTKTNWYQFSKKADIMSKGKAVKTEIALLREFMTDLDIPFTENVDVD